MSGSHVFEKILDTFRSQQDRIGERVWTQGNALSTWLILGNAGALVLLVSSADKFCSPATIRFSATCFALGLVFTFAGLATGFFVSLWSMIKLADIGNHVQGAWITQTFIDGLEDDGIKVPDDAPFNQTILDHQGAMEAGQRKLKKSFVFACLSGLLIVGGAAAFSTGVLHPLLTGNPFSRCVAASISLESSGQAAVHVSQR